MAAPAHARKERTRLLVIDDSPTIRKLVELSFRPTDIVVDFAATGGDGAAKVMRDRPDVVLLDYVLPDMKGTDVCERIARDPEVASVPIIVMSAKGQNVRDLFRGTPGSLQFIGKPFSADDIVAVVRAAAGAPPGSSSAPLSEAVIASRRAPPRFSHDQKQDLATAIYSHLRPALARIPEWIAQMGNAPPAAFFARKLLTPAIVDAMVDEIVAAVRASGVADPPRGGEPSSSFQGEVSGFPVAALLETLDASRTGELTLTHDGDRTIVHVRAGEIVLVSCADPARYQRGSGVDLGHVPADVLERGEAEQRASGKPLYVHLAEAGFQVTGDLGSTLQRHGRRLLIEAANAPRAGFSFRDRAALPLYVEAHGRRIPLAQIKLERARSEGVFAKQPTPSLDRVFERAPMFSHKVHELELTASERRILAAVDGRRSADELATRADVPAAECLAVLQRLTAIDLIRAKAASLGAVGAPRVVMIEPDIDGVQRPLAALLRRQKPTPMTLLTVSPGEDAVAAILREAPRLAILNAGACDATAVARAVRAERRLAHVRLAAVLDAPALALEDDLLSAGFDAVWIKPFCGVDVERLLAG